jgi:hypothetical protein
MKYPVSIEGFEASQIAVETPGFFASAKLLVNGQPAPKGSKRGQYLLHRNDGAEVTAKLKNIFLDPVPQVVINDQQVIKVVEPLKWYQWLWAALPIVLVFIGGALGAVLGLIATSFNTRIFRSDMNVFAQFVIVAVISIAAVVAYFMVALLISGIVG